jgi:hypothetical protein
MNGTRSGLDQVGSDWEQEAVDAYCMVMADDVLRTRRLSSRQALEGCGFPTVSTDDMEAEAIPAQLPVEEVLAAAYFA